MVDQGNTRYHSHQVLSEARSAESRDAFVTSQAYHEYGGSRDVGGASVQIVDQGDTRYHSHQVLSGARSAESRDAFVTGQAYHEYGGSRDVHMVTGTAYHEHRAGDVIRDTG